MERLGPDRTPQGWTRKTRTGALLFRLTFNDGDWNRYSLEGEHAWNVPPVRCGVCASLWKTTGEAYPAVDVGEIAAEYPVATMKALPNDEMDALRARRRPLAPPEAPIEPGADFGPFQGTARGHFGDFAWAANWTMLMKRETEARLRERGVSLPPSRAPELRSAGTRKGSLPDLVEPQAVPLVNLSRPGSRTLPNSLARPAAAWPRGSGRC